MIQNEWSYTLRMLLRGIVVFATFFPSTSVFAAKSSANAWANTCSLPSTVYQEILLIRQLNLYPTDFPRTDRSVRLLEQPSSTFLLIANFSKLADPADFGSQSYINIADSEPPSSIHPAPAEPGLAPPPMPQPAEPGLAPPPMPQPAEPPPLSQRPDLAPPVPGAPGQEPIAPSSKPEPEPTSYEQTKSE